MKHCNFLVLTLFSALLFSPNNALFAQGTKVDYSAVEKCAEAKATPGTVAYGIARDQCLDAEIARANKARDAKRKEEAARQKKQTSTKPKSSGATVEQ